MEYRIIAKSDPGSEGRSNQDGALVRHGKYLGKEIILAAVCDGVGSMECSGEASSHVISKLDEWFEFRVKAGTSFPMGDALEEIEEVLTGTNTRIRKQRKKGRDLATTASVLLILGDEVGIVHVGDTRVYGFNGKTVQLTKDDTFVEREVEEGRMTKYEALRSPQRHVLTRCIGASDCFSASRVCMKNDFDAYLLCSDGFRNEFAPGELLEGIQKTYAKPETEIEKAIEDMILEAIKRGEKDNITCIVIAPVDDSTRILA